jgi:hypothetical protein
VSAKSTGDQSPIYIAQAIWQSDAGVLLSQEVVGMAPVSLPSIGGPQGRGATDHVPLAAVVADTTPTDMVDDDPIPFLETIAAGAYLHNLPTWLVSGDHVLVSLGTVSQMFPIDGSNIAPANRRCFHLHQNLTVARFGTREFAKHHPALAGQNDTFHRFLRCAFDFYRVLGNRAMA